jgi:hypothetical protein
MRRRGVVLLVTVCALMLASPVAASAYVTGSLEITGVTTSTSTSTVTFDARVEHACPDPGPYGPPYCAFFAFLATVPAGTACTDLTTRWVGPITEAVGPAAFTASYQEYASGSAIACLYAYDDGKYILLASAPYAVPGGATGPSTVYPGNPKPPPVPAPPPPAPAPAQPQAPLAPDFAAGLTSEPIPSWTARQRRYVRFSISTSDVPSDVHVERFKAIVRRASGRWGLRAAGVTGRRVRNYDWRNQVGFSWSLRRRTLGVQTNTYLVERVRVCVRRAVSGRCLRTRVRVVSRRLIDRDLAINAAVRWEQGPGYPSPAVYDLESVVIHELGHMAGNDHARMCSNTPMVPALARGEWWRAPGDYDFRYCAGSSGRASTSSVAAGHVDHVTRVVEAPVASGARSIRRAHRVALRTSQ